MDSSDSHRTGVGANLLAALGAPNRLKRLADGSTAHAWTLDPSGDGVALARCAAHDRNGQALMQQVDSLLSAATARGLCVRTLIVANGISGNRRFHERPDLLMVEEEIESGCGWLGVFDRDRISRALVAWIAFADYLRETDTQLFVGRHGELIEPADLGGSVVPVETWDAVQNVLELTRR